MCIRDRDKPLASTFFIRLSPFRVCVNYSVTELPEHPVSYTHLLQQPPGPGYLRTYRNFQTPGQRQHYGRYDKKTPGTQGIPGNRKG